MNSGLELVMKIHADADNTCYSSILRSWEEKTRYEQLEELMDVLCKGVDMETAINMLQIDSKQAKFLLKDCKTHRLPGPCSLKWNVPFPAVQWQPAPPDWR